MARVSRKKQNIPATPADTPVRIWKTALYVRLSVEDNGKDSDFVENQTTLLEYYVANHPNLKKVALFVDNGYTGTDFLRPEFNRMMEAVQAEIVDCIIVKDLSRLGRNYIETSQFIEKICPFYNLRFIAVNDSYDTATHTVGSGRFWAFLRFGSKSAIRQQKGGASCVPVCRAISRENGRLETDAHIFTEGGDDRGGYENRLFCGENWRYDFRCQRNARRERKAPVGGDCKGSDCRRSNGFAESGYCLIDFTRNYVLWGFFKKISQNHLTEGSDPASVHLVLLVSKLLPLCSRQRIQARRIRDLCPCKGDEALLNRIQLFFL